MGIPLPPMNVATRSGWNSAPSGRRAQWLAPRTVLLREPSLLTGRRGARSRATAPWWKSTGESFRRFWAVRQPRISARADASSEADWRRNGAPSVCRSGPDTATARPSKDASGDLRAPADARADFRPAPLLGSGSHRKKPPPGASCVGRQLRQVTGRSEAQRRQTSAAPRISHARHSRTRRYAAQPRPRKGQGVQARPPERRSTMEGSHDGAEALLGVAGRGGTYPRLCRGRSPYPDRMNGRSAQARDEQPIMERRAG